MTAVIKLFMRQDTGKGALKMLIYLVQHAEAKKEEVDPSRSLSEKGLQDIFPI
jgi:hypothetical protein